MQTTDLRRKLTFREPFDVSATRVILTVVAPGLSFVKRLDPRKSGWSDGGAFQ